MPKINELFLYFYEMFKIETASETAYTMCNKINIKMENS